MQYHKKKKNNLKQQSENSALEHIQFGTVLLTVLNNFDCMNIW